MKRQPPGRPGRPGRPQSQGRARSKRETQPSLGGEQVEGRQAVLELLRARRRTVRQVLVAEGTEGAEAVAEIVELAGSLRVPVRRVPRDEIDAAALTEAPQGVLARADPLPERDLDEMIGAADGKEPSFLLVLDGVTDPHNLGAVMRTALCAGATGLVIGRHRSAKLTPAAVKAAAGAAEHLPVATVAGIPAALATLVDAGIWTVGLDTDAHSPLWGLRVATEPVALVLGAEGGGLSRLVRQRCDLVVGIPLSGPIESLNVSVAAGLACFEVARIRRAEGGASV